MKHMTNRKGERIEDPALVKWLLTDPRAGLVWMLPRIWLGLQWINSGTPKLSNPKWVETGEALKGFWTNAVAIPESGRPPITFDWYRGFLQFLLDTESYTWFAKLVAYGEVLVGVALVLGAFTGIAAFAGGFMNWNFMMAGSASTNPFMFVIAVGLILAWKVSGTIGLDVALLRLIGTPWHGTPEPEAENAASKPVLATQ